MATLIVPAPALLSGCAATSPSVPHLIRDISQHETFIRVVLIMVIAPSGANDRQCGAITDYRDATGHPTRRPANCQVPDASCALLDDAQARDDVWHVRNQVAPGLRPGERVGRRDFRCTCQLRAELGTDVLVNNPALDSGSSRTQSETIIARNENTGTICSAYNDLTAASRRA